MDSDIVGFFPSANCELPELARRFAEELALDKDYAIGPKNCEWISPALAQRNPYAAYEGGGAVSILSGGRGKLEGKYHLIADRVSASETKHARNVEPQ